MCHMQYTSLAAMKLARKLDHLKRMLAQVQDKLSSVDIRPVQYCAEDTAHRAMDIMQVDLSRLDRNASVLMNALQEKDKED